MQKILDILLKKPLWTIVGFSLLVHLPGITSPLLDYQAYRQCQTASMARNYVRHGMRFLNPELDTEGAPKRAGTEFPIYSFLLALLYKLGGVHEAFGRVLSALFGAGGTIFLFLFVRRRLGELPAFWSALTMCALPIHVFFTRTVQPEPMALWGLLGFIYYFDRILNDKTNLIPHVVLAVFLGALAPLLKLNYLYILVPMGAYLAWEKGGFAAWKNPANLGLLAAILGLTHAWYHYAKTAPMTVLPLTAAEHWNNLKPILTWKLWENHFISRIPELCLTYTGLLLAIVGARWLWSTGKLRLWAVWFGVTSVYIMLLGNYGRIHRYTELPFAPICAVFIGYGIVSMWQVLQPSRRVILMAAIVIGIPIHTAFRIAHWYRLEYPWVVQAKTDVAHFSTPEDLWITHTPEIPVLLYHMDRYGYSRDLRHDGLPVIAELKKSGARFFLTPKDVSWTEHPEFAAYFDLHALLLKDAPDYRIYRLN
jgi:4-amino-4-deoxy-L-arabinose transferase-like glycosyltransferase